jgi:hypothetical protein
MNRTLRATLFTLLGLAIVSLWLPQILDNGQARTATALKVVRVACTDNVCGGCDGRCHDREGVQYDHVTVRKNGHCTCTPRKGGELDRVLRDAYNRWVSSRRR